MSAKVLQACKIIVVFAILQNFCKKSQNYKVVGFIFPSGYGAASAPSGEEPGFGGTSSSVLPGAPKQRAVTPHQREALEMLPRGARLSPAGRCARFRRVQ